MSYKFLPCRFCGECPICIPVGQFAIIICPSCGHEAKTIKDWQARNEKHNPFLEDKKYTA